MTKGRDTLIFAKSQPPFDVHRQYLDVSLTDSQARVSRFRCRIFSLLCGFLENLARLSLVFIFEKLSAHDFLAFRVIWKQACRLDFSIFLKPCFYGQTSSGRWNFFARLWYIFFLDSCFFPNFVNKFLRILNNNNNIQKNFWKYQTILSKKSNMSQQP